MQLTRKIEFAPNHHHVHFPLREIGPCSRLIEENKEPKHQIKHELVHQLIKKTIDWLSQHIESSSSPKHPNLILQDWSNLFPHSRTAVL